VIRSEPHTPEVEPFLASIALNVLPPREWLTGSKYEYNQIYSLITDTILDQRGPD